jgi:hypothetical protein
MHEQEELILIAVCFGFLSSMSVSVLEISAESTWKMEKRASYKVISLGQ